MSALDRDAARQLLEEQDVKYVNGDQEDLLDDLEACVRPFGWDDMLTLLRTTYPESMIPQYDEADYGNGPQVVSLLRLVTALRQQLADDQPPWIESVQRNGDFQTITFTDGSSVYVSSEQDTNGHWRDGRGIDTVLTIARQAGIPAPAPQDPYRDDRVRLTREEARMAAAALNASAKLLAERIQEAS